MTDLAFLPDIPMDKTHTLDQMTGRFQSLKDGLPELVKNSKDQYMRRGVSDKKDRQIVVLLNPSKSSLGVLDFAGARSNDFKGWQTWSSRTASQAELSGDIEGGHGNGGKAFMVRGSTEASYIDSCAEGLRTKMGFDNGDPERRYLPGYGIANRAQINNIPETNPRRHLDAALADFGVKFQDLPKEAQDCFESRQAFTLVEISGVRDWAGRRKTSVQRMIDEVPNNLAAHAQAALTLETCCVWVLNGKRLLSKQALAREYPEPFPGFDNLAPIPVPAELEDPATEEMVSTGRGGSDQKLLTLRTSAKQLRMTEDRKALNTIRVRNDRNVVANWSVAKLAPRAESAFILGELRVPDLQGEHLADSHRTELADTPLARALEHWVSEQLDALSQRIQKALARETKSEDQEKAKETLDQLRELMREYLVVDPTTLRQEEEGRGDEGPRGGVRTIARQNGPRGKAVQEILLEMGSDQIALAVGTTVPLLFGAYEIDGDNKRHPVVGANLSLEASQPGIVQLKGSEFVVALQEGRTEIWLKDRASGVESNRVVVEALTCAGVDVVGPPEPLMQGQRTKLRLSFQSSKGPRDDLLVEGSIDEGDVGRLSRKGFFTAGMSETDATVRVRYGQGKGDFGVGTVAIGSEVLPATGRGGKGADIPLILMCGDEAPGMEEYPKEMRTHHGGERYPTIIEEPLYGQVVWINPNSKESLRVRQGRGGSVGVGGVATKTFTQFVALKCFDILKRLRVRQELKGTSVTETEFSRQLAQAEVDCAGFIDGAYMIAEELHKGKQGSE